MTEEIAELKDKFTEVREDYNELQEENTRLKRLLFCENEDIKFDLTGFLFVFLAGLFLGVMFMKLFYIAV